MIFSYQEVHTIPYILNKDVILPRATLSIFSFFFGGGIDEKKNHSCQYQVSGMEKELSANCY